MCAGAGIDGQNRAVIAGGDGAVKVATETAAAIIRVPVGVLTVRAVAVAITKLTYSAHQHYGVV